MKERIQWNQLYDYHGFFSMCLIVQSDRGFVEDEDFRNFVEFCNSNNIRFFKINRTQDLKHISGNVYLIKLQFFFQDFIFFLKVLEENNWAFGYFHIIGIIYNKSILQRRQIIKLLQYLIKIKTINITSRNWNYLYELLLANWFQLYKLHFDRTVLINQNINRSNWLCFFSCFW